MRSVRRVEGPWYRIRQDQFWGWEPDFSGIGVHHENDAGVGPFLDTIFEDDWIEVVGHRRGIKENQVVGKVWSADRRRLRGYARVWLPMKPYYFTAESPLEALARVAE